MVGRQARAEVTRQSIIDAGVALFGDTGYGDTDMTDVVQHAGVPGGTCYYYFPTKASLAEAIVEQSNERIAASMGSLWETDAPAFHKLIIATFRFMALSEYDDVVRVGYHLRVSMPSIRQVAPGGFGDTHVLYGQCVKAGVAEGFVRDDINTREAARTLVAAVSGCRVLADQFGDSPIKRLIEAWRTILLGIATEDAYGELVRFVNSAARKRP